MTAEEFFNKYVPEKEEFKIDFSNIIGLMEAYHKAEVKKELNSHKSLCLSILEQSDKPISQRIREVKEQLLKQ